MCLREWLAAFLMFSFAYVTHHRHDGAFTFTITTRKMQVFSTQALHCVSSRCQHLRSKRLWVKLIDLLASTQNLQEDITWGGESEDCSFTESLVCCSKGKQVVCGDFCLPQRSSSLCLFWKHAPAHTPINFVKILCFCLLCGMLRAITVITVSILNGGSQG